MLANKMGMTIGGTNQAAMAATPARFLGSSYSGDAPLGMHAGQQQNKPDSCRREEKKVCGRAIGMRSISNGVCIILLTAVERNPPGRRNAFSRRKPSAMGFHG
jgi:hypothetical protein